MKQIKILEAGFLAPFGGGGIEVVAWNWYKNMNSSNLKIDFMGEAAPSEKYRKYMTDRNSKFFLLKRSPNIVIRVLRRIKFIRSITCEKKYDIVHIHAGNAWRAFQYYIAVKPFCSSIIIHSHSTGIGSNSSKLNFFDKIKFLFHSVCRHLMNSPKVIRLCCSNEAGKWMFPDKYKYTIIKNGIDTSNFTFNENTRKNIRKKLSVENKFVIGHIGRFSYAKNHDFLIDVFEAVHEKNPAGILLLVGCGTLEEHIKQKVKNAGLESSVIFFGAAEKTNELYNAMDCFVFPSHFEGLPIVTVEAQAAGLCTLCSDVVPSEAKITELVEFMPLSESPEKWAEKILGYNNGYQRRDTSEEVKKTGYDIKTSAKQLEELYIKCSKPD